MNVNGRPPQNVLRVLALLFLLSAAFCLTAQDTTLGFSPNAASWADRVTVTARGEACAPLGLSLISAQDFVVTLRLDTWCGLADPPFVAEYEFELEMPRLEIGEWEVVLLNEGEQELARSDVWIHNFGNLKIEARKDDLSGAYDLHLSGYSCSTEYEIEGDFFDSVFVLQGVCDFGGVPLAAEYFELLINDVSPPPGNYRLSVVSSDSFSSRTVATTFFEVPEPVLPPPAPCGDAVTLCLGQEPDQFLVTLSLHDQAAQAVPYLTADGIDPTSGFFEVFAPGNLEVTVKILDGCAINHHFWLFASWTTTLEGQLVAFDPRADVTRIYDKPGGQTAPPIADVEAFACSR